ncbi:hypothetical protein ACIQYF_07800 [Pseudomonas sp. NPDC096917]|uniref:hypothetical protein n=1 Tax=Pseudomonas sp. NPDC096917 TaxID=3364483 RepID=UPI00383A2297
MSTKSNSMESILKSMEGRSVTNKWDAILFYNRSMSNHVLEQEYIKLFTEDRWYDPLSTVLQTPGTTESISLIKVIFSQPMVSFVSRNEEDPEDKPVLQLTWFIKGGDYILYEGRDIRAQGSFNPITGPTLTCQLRVSEGSVSQGKVVLDLNSAWDWKFGFTHSSYLDSDFGYLVKFQLLNAMYPDQQEIVLSEVVSSGGVDWNPTQFKVEVKIPQTARKLDRDSYDDGAIKVYVGLDGNAEGGTPADDTNIYMIPDDKDYTGAIVISNKAIMEKVLAPGFKVMGDDANGVPTITEIDEDTDLYKLDGTEGSLLINGENFEEVSGLTAASTSMLIGKVEDSDIKKAEFTMAMKDDQVKVVWQGYQPLTLQYNARGYTGELNWQKTIAGEFYTVSDTEVALKLEDMSGAKSLMIPGPGMPDAVLKKWEYVTNVYNERVVAPSIKQGLERLSSGVPSFNTFALQSILFKNGNVLSLETVRAPGDMVVFGKFRPALTSIEIVNAMPHLVVGEQYDFEAQTSGQQQSLTWSVAPLSASKEHLVADIGEMDPTTGRYKAPATIPGEFLQVKVTVLDKDSGAESVALVSISKDSIQIVPRKFKVTDGGGTLRFKALSHNKSEITREMPENSISTCEKDPNVSDQWVFTAGTLPFLDPAHPENGTVSYVLEEIKFSTELDTKSALALVVSKSQALVLNYKVSEDKKTAELTASAMGVVKPCHWVKLYGPGTLSEDGLYTFDYESEEEQSIIVNASLVVDPMFSSTDVFIFDHLEPMTQQIRAGNAPAAVVCDIEAMERHNRINRKLNIN